MKKYFIVFLVISFVLFLLNNPAYGNAIFKVSVAQPNLQLNETTTISVWAKIEEQTSGLNGINTWQCDLIVGAEQGGVIEVVDVAIMAPLPMDTGFPVYDSVNTPQIGDILGLGASHASPGSDSAVGVGDFSLLADITVKAIGLGTAGYSVTDAGGPGFVVALRDYFLDYPPPPGNEYGATLDMPYQAVFQSGNNVINVIPEPATILLLGTACLILRRRH